MIVAETKIPIQAALVSVNIRLPEVSKKQHVINSFCLFDRLINMDINDAGTAKHRYCPKKFLFQNVALISSVDGIFKEISPNKSLNNNNDRIELTIEVENTIICMVF